MTRQRLYGIMFRETRAAALIRESGGQDLLVFARNRMELGRYRYGGAMVYETSDMLRSRLSRRLRRAVTGDTESWIDALNYVMLLEVYEDPLPDAQVCCIASMGAIQIHALGFVSHDQGDDDLAKSERVLAEFKSNGTHSGLRKMLLDRL